MQLGELEELGTCIGNSDLTEHFKVNYNTLHQQSKYELEFFGLLRRRNRNSN